MTDEEQKDLDKLKADQLAKKLQCYDYLVHLSRCSDTELLHAGHRKGKPQAILDTVLSFEKDIKKLADAYIRKYPD